MYIALWIAGILYVYFFPSYLAWALRHVDWKGIMFTNLAIGWTILGWFILLVWVFDTTKKN